MLAAGCGASPESRGTPEPTPLLRLRAAHLTDYAWLDRDDNGQPDNLKPEAERAALVRQLASDPVDLLVLRGLGCATSLEHLRGALAEAGADYPHAIYIPGPTAYAGAGFLSRVAPVETRNLWDHTHRVRDRVHRPLAGGILLPGGVWVWNAVAPQPSTAYERRRNEARLLAQALRPLLAEGHTVLLSLHSREDPESPMLRGFSEIGMTALPCLDERGDGWTHRDPEGLNYRLDQWLFLGGPSGGDLPVVSILDSPDLRAAGEFRHQRVDLPFSPRADHDP